MLKILPYNAKKNLHYHAWAKTILLFILASALCIRSTLRSILGFVFQGSATAKEFYKRHHRWTEGLISAAKAVGWGAKVLV